jgi:hypothetical protein
MGYESDQAPVTPPYSPPFSEAGRNVSKDSLIVKPISTWKGYIWDTWELPQDQRRLLFKVDAFILTFASVSLPPHSDVIVSYVLNHR